MFYIVVKYILIACKELFLSSEIYLYRDARTDGFIKRYRHLAKVVDKFCCITSTRLKLHNSKLFSVFCQSLLSNVETGSQELVIFSYVIVCHHPSMSLNNEKICHKLVKIKWQFVRKLQVYGAGTFRI